MIEEFWFCPDLIGSDRSKSSVLIFYWLIGGEWRVQLSNGRLPHLVRSGSVARFLIATPSISISFPFSIDCLPSLSEEPVALALTSPNRGAAAGTINNWKFWQLRGLLAGDVEANLSGGTRRLQPGQWCAWIHRWWFRKQDWRPWPRYRGILCTLVSSRIWVVDLLNGFGNVMATLAKLPYLLQGLLS